MVAQDDASVILELEPFKYFLFEKDEQEYGIVLFKSPFIEQSP